MANIQVNIDVNDNDFKNICIDNINDLPKDKMQELLLKAVEVALIRDKNDPYMDSDSSILVRRQRNTYKYEPTDLMRDIVKEINAKDMLEPLAREVVEFIRDNYKSMAKEMITAAFTKMLFSEMTEYRLRDEIFTQLNKY